MTKTTVQKIVVIGAHPPSLINFRGALLRALSTMGQVTCISAPAEHDVLEKLSDWQIEHRGVPIERNGLNPILDLQTLLALKRELAAMQPDVVLAYTVKPVVWTGLALRRAGRSSARTRFVALITGLGYAFESQKGARGLLQRLVASLYQHSLQRADLVVFQNIDNQDAFVSAGIVGPEKTAVVNGSGVDTNHFEATPIPPIKGEALTFLLVARLLGDKGIREYAGAAKYVKAQYPRCQFLLLGPHDTSPDAIPQNEIDQFEAIEYLGSAVDVRPHIRKCHVYVLPSYHEGMPRTVLEAMAVGRPILTTNVSGCRQTVVEGENGWLVPKADTESLAARMLWFVKNQDQLQSMGERSRQLAEERFEVSQINAAMIKHLLPESQ